MKKITFSLLFILSIISFEAQTMVWSSDSEDFVTDWSITDNDGDGIYWGFLQSNFTTDGIGFSTGTVLISQSRTSNPLTPDNLLITETIDIPENSASISFKMKVAAYTTSGFAEHYAVYVYDNDLGISYDTNIFEETLTAGGNASAKDITASIPNSFSGKTIKLVIRHYNCTDESALVIDDFEISYNNTLSINDNTLEIARVYPNPVKDIVTIDSNAIIKNAFIINQIGQVVMDVKSNNIINNTIDLSRLNKGMYFMSLKSDKGFTTIKIIKD